MSDELEHVEDVEEQVEAVEPETEEPEVDETPEPEPAPQWTDAEAQEAMRYGWKPPEQWKGEKPPGYIDNPNDFLNQNKVLSRRVGELSHKIEETERQTAEHIRKVEAMNKTALERQRAQHKAEMERIQSEQLRAVEEGDVDAYKRLEAQKGQMQAPPVDDAPAKPQAPPELIQYHQSDEGKWLSDPVLFNAAFKVIDETPGAASLPPLDQVHFAREQLERIYPSRFPQKQQAAPIRTTVDPGGMATAKAPSKRSEFDKLPADAKATFKRFQAEGLYSDSKEDREEYAREYNAA